MDRRAEMLPTDPANEPMEFIECVGRVLPGLKAAASRHELVCCKPGTQIE
jgi:hypothetical protein